MTDVERKRRVYETARAAYESAMLLEQGAVVAGPFIAMFPERVWWVTGFPSWATDFGFCWEEAS